MRTSAARLKGKELHLTFREWLLSILNGVSHAASRFGADEIGIVTDFYSNLSIKGFTRNKHGSSSQVNFRLYSKLPEDLMGALTNGQFKSEINSAFTSTDIINSWCWKKDFAMTNGNKLLERIGGIVGDDRLIVMNRAAPSLEEADNRLLLHVKEAAMRGRTNVIVRTVDSDIIVILLGFMDKFLDINPGTSIVVDYGVTIRRLININDSYRHLGDSISKAAMFFHVLSGYCNSTASFIKRTRSICINAG